MNSNSLKTKIKNLRINSQHPC